jgi:hypothetical protein
MNLNGSVVDDGNGGPLVTGWSIASGPGDGTFGNSNSPATTFTPKRSGVYKLRLSASDGQAETSQDLSTLSQVNTNVFEDWIAVFYPGQTNVGVVGPGDDPDGDRVVSFGEFSIGLNPAFGDAQLFDPTHPGLPRGEILNVTGTNYLVLRVKRPTGRLFIQYEAQVSGDLSNWSTAVQVGSPTNNGDGTETLIYRDILPFSQSQQRYIRLRLTKQ